MKLLSTEAEGVNEAVPEEHRRNLVNSSGRVGALLGLLDPPAEGTTGEFQRPTQNNHRQSLLWENAGINDMGLQGCPTKSRTCR